MKKPTRHLTANPAFPIVRAAMPPMTDPCGLLVVLQQKYLELLTGGAPVTIETPLLGRVEFSPVDPDRLSRLIGQIQEQCNRANGQPSMARRPISFEACP